MNLIIVPLRYTLKTHQKTPKKLTFEFKHISVFFKHTSLCNLTERPQGARLLPNRWSYTPHIYKKKIKKNSKKTQKKTQKKITFEFKHISVFFKHTSYLMILHYESYHSTPQIYT